MTAATSADDWWRADLHARAVIDPGRLTAALDRKLTTLVPADHTYLSLGPATTDQTDAIVFVKEI